MSSEDQQQHASLWQALWWLAYDNLEAKEPDGGDSLRAAIEVSYNTGPQKLVLLKATRNQSLVFEGRLGARCDPPPAPGDTWCDYNWTGHGSEFTSIPSTDWPEIEYKAEGKIDWCGIDWEGSKLRTPRGEFIDIRCSARELKTWHPGPRGYQADPPKRRGRKPGSGSYEKDDAPLIKEMGGLIAEGKAASPYAAAMQIVDKAKGGGAPESKARRLVDRYNDELNSI